MFSATSCSPRFLSRPVGAFGGWHRAVGYPGLRPRADESCTFGAAETPLSSQRKLRPRFHPLSLWERVRVRGAPLSSLHPIARSTPTGSNSPGQGRSPGNRFRINIIVHPNGVKQAAPSCSPRLLSRPVGALPGNLARSATRGCARGLMNLAPSVLPKPPPNVAFLDPNGVKFARPGRSPGNGSRANNVVHPNGVKQTCATLHHALRGNCRAALQAAFLSRPVGAFDGRHRPIRIAGIANGRLVPHVTFVVFDAVTFQEPSKLILKGQLAMMLFLAGDVLLDRACL